MAIIIDTADLDQSNLSHMHNLYVYNALDCCITREVFDKIRPQLDNHTSYTYNFEKDLQAPALEMMLRGFRVDMAKRKEWVAKLEVQYKHLDGILQKYAHAVWGKELNHQSPAQMVDFFYNTMGIPEIRVNKKGEWKVSTDREALEKMRGYFYAMPIVNVILALRDVGKKISTLKTGVDRDKRIRTSYNVGGTETGRWSSSENAFGTGGNLQNITGQLREVFVADKGKKLAYIDLEQAESRVVGLLAWLATGKSNYLDACEGGDLHTTTARLVWPKLPWTGDLSHDKKEVAGLKFYRDYTYRDMAKRGGHGCVTAGHEVLTRNGWLPIEELKPGTEIMVWCGKSQRAKFAIPSHIEKKLYTGTLHHFKGTAYDLEVTHDHRMPYRTDERSGVKWQLAEEVVKRKSASLPVSGFYSGSANVSIQDARLHAAFQADAWYDMEKNAAIFKFKKERKYQRLVELLGAYKYTVNIDAENCYRVRVPNPAFVFGGKEAGAYLLDWNAPALEAYIDELEHWDGYRNATNAMWVTTANKVHAEWLNTIARLQGNGSQLSSPKTSGYGSTIYGVSVNNRGWARLKSMEVTKRPVKDVTVYCVTVPTSYFFVRRNGRVMVTGNTNYAGKHRTIAKHLKIQEAVALDFQNAYFKAFPEIKEWHEHTAKELREWGYLITPMNRKRHFFDRLWDDATLRAAIAYVPQSTVADILNMAMLQVWQKVPEVELLAQVHDAFIIQYDEDKEDEILAKVFEAMKVELNFNGRPFSIPSEAQTGWNWAYYVNESDVEEALKKGQRLELNLNGVKKYKGTDKRKRVDEGIFA